MKAFKPLFDSLSKFVGRTPLNQKKRIVDDFDFTRPQQRSLRELIDQAANAFAKDLRSIVTMEHLKLTPIPKHFLHNFSDAKTYSDWKILDDTMIGGRSEGRFYQEESRKAGVFDGFLSLKVNPKYYPPPDKTGFVILRSKVKQMDLSSYNAFEMRVRTDGRDYVVNVKCSDLYTLKRIYTPEMYQHLFSTPPNEWKTIVLRFADFVATEGGMVLEHGEELDPRDVSSIGILIADRKEGPFRCEIEYIKAIEADNIPIEQDLANQDINKEPRRYNIPSSPDSRL